jgi:hypothetical protein
VVQDGLTKSRQTGRECGGRRKFWYLAECLSLGGLEKEKIIAHARGA